MYIHYFDTSWGSDKWPKEKQIISLGGSDEGTFLPAGRTEKFYGGGDILTEP